MTYNGWNNYQTWNVSLHIANQRDLYELARKYAQKTRTPKYDYFIAQVMPSVYGDVTADGVSWTDPTLDQTALDEMIAELAE